jgi:hypothetical protein
MNLNGKKDSAAGEKRVQKRERASSKIPLTKLTKYRNRIFKYRGREGEEPSEIGMEREAGKQNVSKRYHEDKINIGTHSTNIPFLS